MTIRKRAEIEARIREIATPQGGLVTRAQLMELGLSRAAIFRRVRANTLEPVLHRVYTVGVQKNRRMMEDAALLSAGPEAALSHTSALYHWGLIESPRREQPIHVIVPRRLQRPHPKIIFHSAQGLGPDDFVERKGRRMTTVPRTLLDSATVVQSRLLDQAIAIAQGRGLVTQKELAEVVERFRGHPGIRVLRDLVSNPNGPRFVRSKAEQMCVDLILEARLPPPKSNVLVGSYEVDLLWPKQRVIVEIDGRAYHTSRHAFDQDREKSNWLATHGYNVLRVTWTQITKQRLVVAAQIATALATSGGAPRKDAGARHEAGEKSGASGVNPLDDGQFD